MKRSDAVDADANAGGLHLPAAEAAYIDAAALVGNPSAAHALGRAAHARLEQARAEVARALGGAVDEIVFTSGGTESDALAILGALADRGRAPHVVTSSSEHAAVRRTLAALADERAIELTVVRLGRHGLLDPAAVAEQLRPTTALVALTAVCSETGVVQPIAALAAAARAESPSAHLHLDAVQALGKVPLAVDELGIDSLALAGHKLGAVGGCGALWLRRGVALTPVLTGGGQEGGRRAGTENVAGAASLAAALSGNPWAPARDRLAALRKALEARLLALGDVEILGRSVPRVCNTSCLRLGGTTGEAVMMALDVGGVRLSTGSACATGSIEPSPALLGMGLSPAEAAACVRVSLAWSATAEDVERLTAALVRVVARLRATASEPP